MVALLHRANVETGDEMTDRILDAALAELVDFGIRRFSVEHVARRAGINRITIYRRFASKDLLLRGVLLREGATLLAEVEAAIDDLESPVDQLVEGFAIVLTSARRHPLVQRTLAVDPEAIGTLLLSHGPLVLSVATAYLAGRAAALPEGGRATGLDPGVVAELAVRLCLTFVVLPESRIPLDDADEARAFARQYFVPALTPMTTPRPRRSRTTQGAARVRR